MDIKTDIKNIDTIYKNLLENFTPSTKSLLISSKNYLKALHGSSAASSIYIEHLTKFAKYSKLPETLQKSIQNQTGQDQDISGCLVEVATVLKELHDKQHAVLKSFYVDFILPLESNLEKDTKVLQSEFKKYQNEVKHRQDNYYKSVNTVKKINHKNQNRNNHHHHIDREIKSLQRQESERQKLKNCIDANLRSALISHKKRFGFVLERQASVCKHQKLIFKRGFELFENNLDKWTDVSKNREFTNVGFKSDCQCGRKSSENFSNNFNTLKKAIYNFDEIQSNQLAFNQGDNIVVMGPPIEGWQFGENKRTNQSGWFPTAYVASSSSTSTENNLNSSSNDSGISEQIQIQPEIDYSDDDEDEEIYQHPSFPPKPSDSPKELATTKNSVTRSNSSTYNWLSNSKRASSYSSLSEHSANNNQNKIKKIIQRTKSLIFKKDNEQYETELWNSHESLIVVPKNDFCHNNSDYDDDEDEASVFSNPEEIVKNCQNQIKRMAIPPPPPPPMPMSLNEVRVGTEIIKLEAKQELKPAQKKISSKSPSKVSSSSTTINQTIILNANNSDTFRSSNFLSNLSQVKYTKSERTTNLNGPWYDLWADDKS